MKFAGFTIPYIEQVCPLLYIQARQLIIQIQDGQV